MPRLNAEREPSGEQEFGAIFEQTTAGIAQCDRSGRFTLVNQRFCQIVGRTAGELYELRMHDITHPDDLRNNLPLFEALVSDGTPFCLEKRYVLPDGSHRWVENNVSAVKDDEGRVVRVLAVSVDVQHRKRIEHSLADQRRLYEGVLSTTPDLAYVFDREHRFIYVNDGLLKMWGKTWDEAIGKTCHDLGYEPWHAEMHGREIDQVVATKQPIRGVVPFTGTYGCRLYDYILTPVLDPHGEVQAVAGITRDVTDIKQTEQALRESEERLAAELAGMRRLHELSMRLTQRDELEEVIGEVMEAAGELLGAERCTAQLLDRDHRGLRMVASKGFDEIFLQRIPLITELDATCCAAVLGQQQRVIIEDLTADPRFAEFAAMTAPLGIAAAMSTPLVSHAGALLGVFTTYWPQPHVPDEHQLRLLDLYVQLAARHVERRAAELALRESQAQLQAELTDTMLLQRLSAAMIHQEHVEALYEQVMDAAVALMRSDCASLQMLYADRGAGGELRLLASRGFTPHAIRFWQWVSSASGSSCGEVLRLGQRSLVSDVEQRESMQGTADLDAYRESGIRAVQSTPLISRGGNLIGVLSTHWKQPHEPRERDLRLLDLLARQAADLIERMKAGESLREADRRKDEFLATLAHELRNPLAPIRWGLEVMRLAQDKPGTIEEVRRTMVRQTEQLVRLIDDLMDVSRISRGKLQLQLVEAELSDIVRSAVEATSPFIDERGHRLRVELPQDPTFVVVDPHRLAQVLSNLLHNAAKYSPQPDEIRLTAERNDRDLVLSVRDRGLGIPPDKLGEVFEMFAQIGHSGQDGYTGLGIGLTLAKSLVEMHGGAIDVSSGGPNQGTEFLVRIPGCVRRLNGAQDLRLQGDGAPTSLRRVLIVDDNKDAAQVLSITIRLLGNQVRVAHDGVEALKSAAEFQPEVVLLDLGMPRMDGYEVAHHIRQSPWGKQTILVALTGWGQDEDKRKTQAAGFNHHLVKPATPAQLKAILAERTAV